MLRELNENEMMMVSGGTDDEIVVVGVRAVSGVVNSATVQEELDYYFNNVFMNGGVAIGENSGSPEEETAADEDSHCTDAQTSLDALVEARANVAGSVIMNGNIFGLGEVRRLDREVAAAVQRRDEACN